MPLQKFVFSEKSLNIFLYWNIYSITTAIRILNANKEEEKPVKIIEDDDQLQIEMLEKLLAEKKAKMQKQKEEAEM